MREREKRGERGVKSERGRGNEESGMMMIKESLKSLVMRRWIDIMRGEYDYDSLSLLSWLLLSHLSIQFWFLQGVHQMYSSRIL